jgi:hypothetical protein
MKPAKLPAGLIEVTTNPSRSTAVLDCNRARSESVVVGIFDNAQDINRLPRDLKTPFTS